VGLGWQRDKRGGKESALGQVTNWAELLCTEGEEGRCVGLAAAAGPRECKERGGAVWAGLLSGLRAG